MLSSPEQRTTIVTLDVALVVQNAHAHYGATSFIGVARGGYGISNRLDAVSEVPLLCLLQCAFISVPPLFGVDIDNTTEHVLDSLHIELRCGGKTVHTASLKHWPTAIAFGQNYTAYQQAYRGEPPLPLNFQFTAPADIAFVCSWQTDAWWDELGEFAPPVRHLMGAVKYVPIGEGK